MSFGIPAGRDEWLRWMDGEREREREERERERERERDWSDFIKLSWERERGRESGKSVQQVWLDGLGYW